MRRRLREYIDDPSLLDEISIERLQEWADEVPYAGLIHRLMAIKAQKLEDGPLKTSIMRHALLRSNNPDQLLSPLQPNQSASQEVIVTDQDERPKVKFSSEQESKLALDSDVTEEVEEVTEVYEQADATIKSDKVDEESNDLVKKKHEGQSTKFVESSQLQEHAAQEEGLDSFTTWLQTLQNIEEEVDSDSDVSLEMEVVSESLAELLLSQGHTSRAIDMYKQLQLKYPEKSSFFAAQIEKIQA